LSYLLHNYSLKAPTSAVLYPPERASHFELLKEFQAAQNTTCHLPSANTISFINCTDSILISGSS